MFEAFILAGGRSSRMGKNKPEIELGGSTLLQHAADVLQAAGASRIAVVSSAFAPAGIETIPDIFEGRGALGGIHSAMKHASGDTVFILACDFPFVTAGLIELLLDKFDSHEYDAVIPAQPDGRIQPLAAVYGRERCLAECEAILGNDEASGAVNALIDRLKTRVVAFEEYSGLENSQRLLLNLNTPEDLEKAEKLVDQGQRV